MCFYWRNGSKSSHYENGQFKFVLNVFLTVILCDTMTVFNLVGSPSLHRVNNLCLKDITSVKCFVCSLFTCFCMIILNRYFSVRWKVMNMFFCCGCLWVARRLKHIQAFGFCLVILRSPLVVSVYSNGAQLLAELATSKSSWMCITLSLL